MIHLRLKCHLVESCEHSFHLITLKTFVFASFWHIQTSLAFSRQRSCYAKSEFRTSYIENCRWWQIIRSHVKWGMTSFRCYGNSDPGLGRWIWSLEVPGSNPPPSRYPDLFLVVPSSPPRLRCVSSQLISLPPVGILNSLCSIYNIWLVIYSISN